MMPQRKVPTATMMMRLYLSPKIPQKGETKACAAVHSQSFTTQSTSDSTKPYNYSSLVQRTMCMHSRSKCKSVQCRSQF